MLKGKSNLVKKFLTTTIVTSFFLVAGVVTASAAVPAFTSATYDNSTGVLTLTGTNFAEVGSKTDIDPKKIMISDGKNHVYTLSSPKVDKDSATSVAITLSVSDRTALSEILDNAGTAAQNGGTYQVNLLSGWNGSTSVADFTTNALTVSGVTTLTSATYDYNTGALVLTGTNIISAGDAATLKDVTPKFFTISNGTNEAYTLKTSPAVKRTSATSATITLNATDKAELESVISTNGTYYLDAAYGWNGKYALAVPHVAVTVSNYAAPVVSVKTSSLKYGQSLTATTHELKSTKAGTIYVVTQAAIDAGLNITNLEAYVTAKAGFKVAVKASTPAAVGVTSKNLTLTTDSAIFYAVAVDKADVLSAQSTNAITINNVNAPALSATVSKGATAGVKATTPTGITVGTGNHWAYKIVDTAVSSTNSPLLYTTVSDATTYTLGTDITGTTVVVDKYLNLYELNSDNAIIKFKQVKLTLTNLNVAASDISYAVTSPAGISTTYGGATKTFTVTVPNGTASVVLSTTPATGQTLAKGGTDATLVTLGGTTTKTITVNTDSVKAAGGSKTFTITVAKSGYTSITYNITVTVSP